jgi:hypothetical protein
MSSLIRSDILWCRILLDIADPEVLPSFQWIEYIHRSSEKIFLRSEVDQVLSRSDTSGIGKQSTTYWRSVEPSPKHFAGESSVKGGSEVLRVLLRLVRVV